MSAEERELVVFVPDIGGEEGAEAAKPERWADLTSKQKARPAPLPKRLPSGVRR